MKLYLKDVRKTVKRTERKVDAGEVIEAFNRSPLSRLQLMLVDRDYWVVPELTWFDILNWSQVDRIKYRAERQDCDDFAKILNGEVVRKFQLNSIGTVLDFSGAHAYVAVVLDDNGRLEVAAVEPQTDRTHVAATRHRMYAAQNGLVTF